MLGCQQQQGSGQGHHCFFLDVYSMQLLALAFLVKEMSDEAVVQLVRAKPFAARIRDNSGRLPLHWACAKGKSWKGEIQPIVQAFPGALDKRDAVEGLFPFMLAAAGECSYGTIYKLLRSRPAHCHVVVKR